MKKIVVVVLAMMASVVASAKDINNLLANEWKALRGDEKRVTFKFDDNCGINLDNVVGKGKANEECDVVTSFTLEEDMKIGFCAGADWWFEAFLNDEKIWSTYLTGNCDDPKKLSKKFVGNAKKGENKLRIRVRRGGDSWFFGIKQMAAEECDPFGLVTIVADPATDLGNVKIMNAVNNGPRGSKNNGGGTQPVSNMKEWIEAKIPYARNHDASFYAGYGGEHTVDVHMIFPDFSKDPNDPASYVFGPTDKYLKTIQEGGTKVFYRLGSKIEHGIYKYGTRVPPDFKKWAVICEHIIRHYTEGWANGYKWDIEYWEIWNEADLSIHSKNKPTWQGTQEEFFDLYTITAKHLKKNFPNLKIGGPASFCVWGNPFIEAFLAHLQKNNVPMDFFSWHLYTVSPNAFISSGAHVKEMLEKYGYGKAESILNEWNYVSSFEGAKWLESLKIMVSQKGAAFIAASMSASQESVIDMLMYYDARPCGMNGMFHQAFLTPLKGYYPFLAWSKLRDLGTAVKVDTKAQEEIFATAAKDKSGNFGMMVTRYHDDKKFNKPRNVALKVNGVNLMGAKVYMLDENRDFEEVPYFTRADGSIIVNMPLNTMIYLEKKAL